jgi:hypothetical protein
MKSTDQTGRFCRSLLAGDKDHRSPNAALNRLQAGSYKGSQLA